MVEMYINIFHLMQFSSVDKWMKVCLSGRSSQYVYAMWFLLMALTNWPKWQVSGSRRKYKQALNQWDGEIVNCIKCNLPRGLLKKTGRKVVSILIK